jgi:predicted ATP-grasp superfamily ATP-dependent carboligase/ubiquinone/menaquinone biosynthesis C-methylase UbiE
VPILVLRRSIMPLQHGALAVARSAGRLGVPVYVTRDGAREPSTNSRYVSGSLPLAHDAPADEWVDALEALGPRFHGAILLPIDDLAATLVGDHQDRLAKVFRLPSAPIGIHRRLASKRELWHICRELALPTPRSTFPADESELIEQAEDRGYPIVLKRAEPWFAPRDPGAPSVAIVRDRRELLDAYARMESDVQPQVMVQDYIPGGSDSVWMFNAYVGAGARCRCAFTGRKLRQTGAETGPTTLGVCEANPEVVEIAERLLGALDYRGIVDMGVRYDARDGSYRLLDVNPRLGSTFRLFVSDDGLDVVRALHLDLTGRAVPESTTPDGRKWIDEPNDLVTCARMARARALGPVGWARTLRGVREGAWWAGDDPRPLVGLASAFPVRLGRRVARPVRRSPAPVAVSASDASRQQQLVDGFFDRGAGYWRGVYDTDGLQGMIYRQRMEVVTAWTRELGLAAGAAALDVGCGAGLTTVELARAGLAVTGTDSSAAMVATATALAEQSGLADRIAIRQADAHRLPFEDGAFELVVALGLLPWLRDAPAVVGELSRVLAPGGSIMLTADNRHRLNRIVEPRESPLLSPLRPVRRALRRGSAEGGSDVPTAYRHAPHEVDEMLAGVGVRVTRRTTIGYGPFTVLCRPVLPERAGAALHERLQRSAAEHARLRGGGWHYVVAGVKRAGLPSEGARLAPGAAAEAPAPAVA